MPNTTHAENTGKLDGKTAKHAQKKILYAITKSNFGEALTRNARQLRNPRFLTLALDGLGFAVFLHGELPFPDPLPRAA
ncbi:MAG: hypothetical protein COZ49_03130 [Candidatus Yonathbacteria bacterium CG_4_10_14_3_um_filter_47_65]|uniref:Uncharacterized protein n=2 Tax=Parcubacteria group TaxID=1794811 RepID=A0A2M8D596_9BACT|nr:MAG: hypothetical protein AUJ44_02565 [Candidatus Nomurabacteria bacterium CG1_02_47_685]PIP03325.1 MAG: hypothetical protein COX54_04055 [Candidatus Yonathbacteria bacterium CG23_combo_of_CG06-09_8_20_14_all_46_18]PIQ31434.1 MAG: hypothetical protein COW61_03660 [Candidatus Yonathbacteria bacterium CG17_big_fil_post_rev_8_21_14_2_50_46_19]PIX56243.1 MAG: hypothetical protein COZ49_03130 [Candidatus Yonathbacteria bacterium CG_4_10_14_3_um_filter_47_65]PIY58010.1 MAG: hypothetical protein CO